MGQNISTCFLHSSKFGVPSVCFVHVYLIVKNECLVAIWNGTLILFELQNPAKCSTVTLDRQQDPIKIWVIHFSDQAIVAESARLSEVQVKETRKPLESLPRTIGFSFILNDAYFRVIRPE